MGQAGVGCARRSGACARVVVVRTRVVGVRARVVFPEENAREYLHEDDDGDETRSTENLPYRLHRGRRRFSGRRRRRVGAGEVQRGGRFP